MMGVSPTRVCTGTNVSVDYSHSYSPSSTIATWEIDWGDGNTTGAAWPGAGSSNHPAGGYALPGYYTITLTVIDLLGAYGYAQQQVEVIDCLLPEIEMFGGCGASGVWKTETAGINWDTSGLNGILIHDIKPTWFSIGTETIELWAATENGLYHSVDSGITWGRVVLPLPDDYIMLDIPPSMTVISITPSKFMDSEIYVLVSFGNVLGIDSVWLFRTVDRGITWTSVLLQTSTCADYTPSFYKETDQFGGQGTYGHQLAIYNGILYAIDPSDTSGRIGVRDDATQTWSAINGVGISRFIGNIMAGDGTPYHLWVGGAASSLTPGETLDGWDGVGWTRIDPENRIGKWDLFTSGGLIYTPESTVALDNNIRVWNPDGTLNASVAAPLNKLVWGGIVFEGKLFITASSGANPGIYSYSGGAWTFEHNSTFARKFVAANGVLRCITPGSDTLHVRDAVGNWTDESAPTGEAFLSSYVHHGVLTDTLYIGTTKGKIFRRDTSGYTLVASVSCDSAINDVCELHDIILHYDTTLNEYVWIASAVHTGTSTKCIFRLPGPGVNSLSVPAEGLSHIIDMNANGFYVYIGLQDNEGGQIICRVKYDLTTIESVYAPGDGSWCGVACDPYYSEVVWIFGDFGATSKVLYSDDNGDTFNDITDASWAAAELVRPVLLSLWETNDVVAILNTDNEVWQTKDYATWVEIGSTAFTADCGARDPFEPNNIWIGRVAPGGANHIQYSPNEGRSWIEHSGGFEPNAPVTALAVTK